MQNAAERETRPDKRRRFRIESNFRVETSLDDESLVGAQRMKDISLEGICLSSSEPIEAGRAVRMWLPEIDAGHPLEGRVVWCQADRGNAFEIGVRFTEDGEPGRERLCARVREIETYRRTVQDVHGRHLSPGEAAHEWSARFQPSTRG